MVMWLIYIPDSKARGGKNRTEKSSSSMMLLLQSRLILETLLMTQNRIFIRCVLSPLSYDVDSRIYLLSVLGPFNQKSTGLSKLGPH